MQDVRTANEVEVAIVGSGFSGLAMAARLKRSGREDFVVLEKAGEAAADDDDVDLGGQGLRSRVRGWAGVRAGLRDHAGSFVGADPYLLRVGYHG